MPVTNTTPGTATLFGPFPVTLTQDVNDGGVTQTVWYVHEATAGDNGMISVFAWGDLSSYVVEVSVYQGLADANTLTPYLDGFINYNAPVQVPVTVGTSYYIRCRSSYGNVPTAILSLAGLSAPSSTIPVGGIGVSDHTGGGTNVEPYPLVVYDPVSGDVLRFFKPFAAGNHADILDNGISLWESTVLDPKAYQLYSAQLVLIASPLKPWVNAGSVAIIGTNATDKFYVGDPGFGGPIPQVARVATVSQTGVVGGTTWTLPAVGLVALQPSRDDTILYYAGQTSSINAPVKRWDLVNNLPLSDLVAGVPSYVTQALTVLANGTILALYARAGVDSYIKHYAADGSTLNTYAFGSGSGGTLLAGLLARAVDDPLSFWVWAFDDTNATSHFINVRISDGAHLVDLPQVQFETGSNEQNGANAVPNPARWGNSDSCPFLVLRAEIAAPSTPTGTIVVTKTTPTLGTPPPGLFSFTATGLSPATFSLLSGASRTFSSVPVGAGYGIAEAPQVGWTANYTVSNGSPINNLAVSSGQTTTVTVANVPAYTTTPRIIRRLRRAPHIASRGQRVFHKRFLLDLQPGIGNVVDPGSNPQVMLRYSDNGGQTWNSERWMSAGELGRYFTRLQLFQLGQARDRIYELVVSDPVAWTLITAFLDIEEGMN